MHKKFNTKILTWSSVFVTMLLCLSGAFIIATDDNGSSDAATTTDALTYTMTAGVLTISGDGVMKDFTSTNTLNTQFPGFTSVMLSGNITTIGAYAFSGSGITSITIPNTILTIGDFAFSGSDLVSLTIPDTVTAIGKDMCYSCSDLTTVDVGSGITAIPNVAFQACASLSDFTYTDSVTSIGSAAFQSTAITSFTIYDSVTYLGHDAFGGVTSLTSVTISSSITDLGYNMFYGCTSLTSVIMKEGISTIGVNAFFNCTSLIEISIPESVTYIGESAFSGCTLLTDLSLHYTVTVGANATGTATVHYYAIVDFNSLSSLIASYHVVVGSEIGTLPEPVRNNYSFGGWYDSSYLYRYYSASTITEDTTLNAYWTPLTLPSYVIIFDAAGGSGAIPYEQISWGDVMIDPKSPTRDGYTFAGWRTVGGDAYDFDTVVTESFTIYAAWTENEPGPAMEPVKVISLLTIILAIIALALIFVMIRYHFDLYVGLVLIADLAVLALNYLYQIV